MNQRERQDCSEATRLAMLKYYNEADDWCRRASEARSPHVKLISYRMEDLYIKRARALRKQLSQLSVLEQSKN